jgi:hypothetical protein
MLTVAPPPTVNRVIQIGREVAYFRLSNRIPALPVEGPFTGDFSSPGFPPRFSCPQVFRLAFAHRLLCAAPPLLKLVRREVTQNPCFSCT